MQLDLLNEYHIEKSTDQNRSTLINMYLEEEQTTKLSQYPYYAMPDPPKGVYKVIAYPTFGLSLFSNTLQANVRAMEEHNNVLYAVCGNQFGSVDSNGGFVQIGTNLNTSSGFAKMIFITGGSDTNNQICIIDGTNGYAYNISTTVATFPIADTDFPQTAQDITEQDDYTIVEKNGSMSFFISSLSSTITWAALDFASKFRRPDRLVGLISYKGELWLCGQKSMEVWTNTGNPLFPFERRSDVLIEAGLAARSSLVIAASSLFGIIKSKTGGYSISVLSTNSPPVAISSKSVMLFLDQLTNISDAIGYAYAKQGHEFLEYVFPTDNSSITYDISNQTYIMRKSLINGIQGRFLGNCHAFCYGKSLIGDFNSGKIYSQESNVYTENGAAITRQFISPHVTKEGKRIFCHRLQIDVQTNVGQGTFLLEMSLDRGNTWEIIDTYTVPADIQTQIYTTSLGSSYSFTFRLTTSDNFNFTLMGFQAEVSVGSN